MLRKRPSDEKLIELLDWYDRSTPKERSEYCRSVGIAWDTLKQWAALARKFRPQPETKMPLPAAQSLADKPLPPIVLPPVKLSLYESKATSTIDEEVQVLQTGDGHAGKITPTYNPEIYAKRMETMGESLFVITDLHRHMYPIKTLHILNTGDNVQGENPKQGSRLGEASVGARDQLVKIALPAWVSLILSLRQAYERIIFDGFPGNHGQAGPDAPKTSNWDLMLYDLLHEKIGSIDGITINVHEQFGSIIDIAGFGFFGFHGDEVRSHQGVPLFALARRVDKWFIQYGGFNYAFCGHFHKKLWDEQSAVTDVIMNSTLVSDDDWSLRTVGISSKPSAWTYGVHRVVGVTWRYSLIVDKQFLPERRQGQSALRQLDKAT